MARALERMSSRRRRELAIRRYWLVTAFRELEPAKDPLERVLRMLADDPGTSPLWNEVRLRAQLVPNWPFSPLFDEVIEIGPIAVASLATILYDIRWQAALQIGSWRLVLDDVPGARLRFREHPPEWTRLLLQVVDRIAWIGEPVSTKALGELVVEIERGAKGDRTFDADLHRLDFLRDLVPQWFGVKPKSTLEAALLDFIAVSWRGRWETVRARLVELCGHLAGNLTSSMRILDEWVGSCPLVFAQLVRTINEGYHLNRPRPALPEDMRAAFDAFLMSCPPAMNIPAIARVAGALLPGRADLAGESAARDRSQVRGVGHRRRPRCDRSRLGGPRAGPSRGLHCRGVRCSLS